MAVDFPPNPQHGDTFGTWIYDSTVPGWRANPDVATGMPAGSIMVWGTDAIPTNWLLCNGAAVSRTTYTSLFNAIGVTYGVGDGATTFNLPDLRGKVAVGKDATQTEFDLLGETGGNKSQAKYGDGTTTGYGATYSSSLGTGDATGSNLPPYQVVNYIIKFSAGISAGDSDLATRVGALENKFNTGQNDAPAGSITQFGGSTIPTNWLLCDGSAVSRATWPSLYAAIGTTYGSGDGSTTFNLPDIPSGTASGIVAQTSRTSTIGFSATTETDFPGLSLTTSLKAGRTYRISFSAAEIYQPANARMYINWMVNGTNIDRQYLGDPAVYYGQPFYSETMFTPSTDLNGVVVKLTGRVDNGSATFNFYADVTQSKIYFTVEDLGESGSSVRPKHIIKATAGIATNESAFVTRVGAVETVNDTQNTRLTNLETTKAPLASPAFTGNVTKSSQSAFLVYTSTGTCYHPGGWQTNALLPTSTGVSTLSVNYNIGNNFNTTTGRYTAPVAGKYVFYAGGWAAYNGAGNRYAVCFTVNNGATNYISGANYSAGDSPVAMSPFVLHLAAGDFVLLSMFSSVATTMGTGSHYFYYGGYFLG